MWQNYLMIKLSFQKQFEESGEKPETMTQKDAAMFPLISSAALFGLYIFFQVNLKSSNSFHEK